MEFDKTILYWFYLLEFKLSKKEKQDCHPSVNVNFKFKSSIMCQKCHVWDHLINCGKDLWVNYK